MKFSEKMSNIRTLKIVLNRNEVKNYMESLDNRRKKTPAMTMRTRSATLERATELTKRKRETDVIDVNPKPKRALKDSKSKCPPEQQIAIPSASKQIYRRVAKMPQVPKNALMPILYKNELVWAYIKGYPSWPGVIEEVTANGKFMIHFFGDYSRAQVTRRYIMNFFEGFNQFSSNFGNVKLRKAVEEAKFFLFDNGEVNECYVCKMLAFKRQFLRGKQLQITNDK